MKGWRCDTCETFHTTGKAEFTVEYTGSVWPRTYNRTAQFDSLVCLGTWVTEKAMAEKPEEKK